MKTKNSETGLLIEEPHRHVSPTLALALGGYLSAALVQQLYYWMPKAKTQQEGISWVYKTYPEWNSEFPWVSQKTLINTIRDLEKKGIFISKQPKVAQWNRTKYYTLDLNRLCELVNAFLTDNPSIVDRDGNPVLFELVESSSSTGPQLPVLSTKSTDNRVPLIEDESKSTAQTKFGIEPVNDYVPIVQSESKFTDEQVEEIYNTYPCYLGNRKSHFTLIRKTLHAIESGEIQLPVIVEEREHYDMAIDDEFYPEQPADEDYDPFYSIPCLWPPKDAFAWLLSRAQKFRDYWDGPGDANYEENFVPRLHTWLSEHQFLDDPFKIYGDGE